ncbi:hypothetical protein ELQ92_12610 [Labedella populi]|uniref:Uncharacterized protein n=1 Tax=Labedella populi TaxID=2498850 RepID=A0A3S3ZLG8_9MICO|nr:hypothetical protein [Labedella populi]RWZ59658.1 hypothetical protein ELQ92_12610 [Labedella populi]
MERHGRGRAGAVVAASAALLAGCAAGPRVAESPDLSSDPSVAPSSTRSESVTPLQDGFYRAAVYVSDGAASDGVLAAGTLVDLGDGCLGLESTDGQRFLVAFPDGTTLEDGVVTAVGMAPFGLGQPLRYEGAVRSLDDRQDALALPVGCPDDVTDVWYFVVPNSAGVGGPGAD